MPELLAQGLDMQFYNANSMGKQKMQSFNQNAILKLTQHRSFNVMKDINKSRFMEKTKS